MAELNNTTETAHQSVKPGGHFSTASAADPAVHIFEAWDMIERAAADSPDDDERTDRIMETQTVFEREMVRTEATTLEGVTAKLRMAHRLEWCKVEPELVASAIRDLERMGEDSFTARFGGVAHPAAA